MRGNFGSAVPAGSVYAWTAHAQAKMRFYGLSPARVRRVLHSPLRVEEGIASGTVAALQPASYKTKEGKRSWSQEIWVMYKITNPVKSLRDNGAGNKQPTTDNQAQSFCGHEAGNQQPTTDNAEGMAGGKRQTANNREKGADVKDDKAREWIASMRRALKGERKVKIISAWRYPGVTKPGAPLPQEIADEIEEAAGIW